MKITRRNWMALPVLSAGQHDTFHFAYDGVMGTSLDLWVVSGDRSSAQAAERQALGEIDRLCSILSTYQPDSFVSQLAVESSWKVAPKELWTLLSAYEEWGRRTGGAISASPLSAAQRTKIELDPSNQRVRISGGALNLDALGKSFVVELAASKAAETPGIQGLLLNVGGDICIRGRKPLEWKVSVADPNASAENALPLSTVLAGNSFLATSAFYSRGAKHIWDPRQRGELAEISSATVQASDAISANALSTAICVLGMQAGLALVNATPGAEALIVNKRNQQFRSRGWNGNEVRLEPAQTFKGWGEKNEVSILLKLRTFEGRRGKRPYVAVWAETEQGAVVKNIAVWIGPNRWWSDLYSWWKLHEGKDLNPITRATRQAGDYKLVWDGLGDNGKPLPAGNYRIIVEVNREHGTYAKQQGLLNCGAEKASLTLKETAEFEAVQIEYGPRSTTA